MNDLIIYSRCPCCQSTLIHAFLEAEDFTVSHEKFSVWHCDSCTVRFTQNVPASAFIGKYYQSAAYVSHSDTKKGLINRLYHLVRNLTLQSKRKLVERSTKNKKGVLLDVGAGTGAFAHTMQASGWTITGLEPDETARKNALQNYQLQLETLETLHNLPASNFDVITLWHVLEHVHDLHDYLERFKTILKPDGALIIAVPNYTSADASHYKEYWAAYDVPRHLYHFSPKSMDALVKQHGFAVKGYKPMWFDSFYVSMLSEQYKSGRNKLLKALWRGLLSNLKAAGDAKQCSSVIYIIRKS